ncbi:MAG TPA: polysaccharide biosynthesis/export family protein [Fimbriiglobus sp.]|nr:polysaccharide biosynthesis/export family protein [Fimbriiglobus sp.]
MGKHARAIPVRLAVLVLSAFGAGLGCAGSRPMEEPGPLDGMIQSPSQLPRELNKVNQPDYVIEPPDVLLINATRVVPLPPYRFGPLDTLLIRPRVPLPATFEPLEGEYVVEPDGRVNLGPFYGSVSVDGMTAEEASAAIEAHLKPKLKDAAVFVSPLRTKPLQQITGEHLVRPDGKVSLGTYGLVRVCGLTVTQARQAVEAHLRQFLKDPEVSVDVIAFNSKVYYVIMDLGGNGQQIVRLPATGNETVLDAIGQVNGLSQVSSTNDIWVARPAPDECGGVQVLPVDWKGITTRGQTTTNYQLFPGDRVYVKANALVKIDTAIARIISPMERILGFTLLGSGVVKDLSLYPASRFVNGGSNSTSTR